MEAALSARGSSGVLQAVCFSHGVHVCKKYVLRVCGEQLCGAGVCDNRCVSGDESSGWQICWALTVCLCMR